MAAPPPHWFKVASATFLARGSNNKWSCDIIVIASEGSRAVEGQLGGLVRGVVLGFFKKGFSLAHPMGGETAKEAQTAAGNRRASGTSCYSLRRGGGGAVD